MTEEQQRRLPQSWAPHTTEEASRATGVPEGTLRAWKARNRVKPFGSIPGPGGEVLLWELGAADFQAAVAAYHQRKRAGQ